MHIHPPNFRSNTIWTGDNLYIMRGMNSATIDLIYLDPPFNSKANYAAPIGSKAAGAAFKDTWTLNDVDIEWLDAIEKPQPALWRVLMAAMNDSDKSYLIYMAIRLLEMKRLLKPTGSIYLHCDPTMSHYLKLIMDAIFGRKNFRNEIVWHYQAGTKGSKRFGRKHDIIFLYTKGREFTFNRLGKPVTNPDRYNQVDSDGRKFLWGGNWDKNLKRGSKRYYLDEGVTCDDVWTYVQETEFNSLNSQSMERTGYPTQKPLALLDRIIHASSNKGNMVFDPFCGCATTCVAAHNHGRNWVGIDISEKAADLVVERISMVQGSLYEDIIHRTDIPQRNDLGKLPPYNCPENKEKLYGKQQGYCANPECGTHFEMRHLDVDHIIARSKGGTDHIDNLQLLCANCNRIKGSRGMEYLRKRLRLAA